MLIRNQDQQDMARVIRHKSCAWCNAQLDYPRIVADDATRSSYHVSCALRLVGTITTDVQALLDDTHAADLVKHIEVSNLLRRTGTPPQ